MIIAWAAEWDIPASSVEPISCRLLLDILDEGSSDSGDEGDGSEEEEENDEEEEEEGECFLF